MYVRYLVNICTRASLCKMTNEGSFDRSLLIKFMTSTEDYDDVRMYIIVLL